MKFKKPNKIYKIVHKFLQIKPITWFLSHTAPFFDKVFFKLSRGRFSFAQIVSGLPVVLIECIGAKSGKIRKAPLLGIPIDEQDHLVLIASNWGKSNNPSWYYNLIANPELKLTYKGQTDTYTALDIVEQEKYNAYWQTAVSYYSGYEKYKERTNRSKIPIILLVPNKNNSEF